MTGAAKYRIPDVLNHGQQLIGEVKNVGYLRYTQQIQDFNMYAQKYGYRFELTIRASTTLSSRIVEEVARGNIILRYLP